MVARDELPCALHFLLSEVVTLGVGGGGEEEEGEGKGEDEAADYGLC